MVDAPTNGAAEKGKLKRSLGIVLLSLYGVGVTVGAGIYVLVGKVAGEAGFFAPYAFMLAAALAGLTALSYGELAAKFPESAGEAVYVKQAFGSSVFATIAGLLVAMTGLVSAAVITLGFVGYLGAFVTMPDAIAVIGLLIILSGLAIWGITESVTVSAIVTVLEIGGLLLVIFGGMDDALSSPMLFDLLVPPMESVAFVGVLNGAVLAFFAFIGFEDMVNVAEEVRDPERTIPRAIIITLGLSTLLYLLIAVIAVTSVPLDELIASGAPLALVFERTTGQSPQILAGIAVFAVLNGALIQIIMGARIFYGLAAKGWLPAILARVEARTRTPALATILVTLVVAVLALGFPIVGLAEATSYITLSAFTIVNVALLRLRLTGRFPHEGGIPIWVPALGAVASFGIIVATLIV